MFLIMNKGQIVIVQKSWQSKPIVTRLQSVSDGVLKGTGMEIH